MQYFDNGVLDFIQNNMKNDFFDNIMPIITSLAGKGFIWIVIAILFFIKKKYRRYGIMISLSLILCLLIGNVILKPWIARPRPFDLNPIYELIIAKPLDYSFPSGHTMSSFAPATVLYYMDKRIGLGALLLSALIAFSRMYLYVHYPSDVIAGAALGIGVGALSILICNKLLKNRI